jgi:hypothetical protein
MDGRIDWVLLIGNPLLAEVLSGLGENRFRDEVLWDVLHRRRWTGSGIQD